MSELALNWKDQKQNQHESKWGKLLLNVAFLIFHTTESSLRNNWVKFPPFLPTACYILLCIIVCLLPGHESIDDFHSIQFHYIWKLLLLCWLLFCCLNWINIEIKLFPFFVSITPVPFPFAAIFVCILSTWICMEIDLWIFSVQQ